MDQGDKSINYYFHMTQITRCYHFSIFFSFFLVDSLQMDLLILTFCAQNHRQLIKIFHSKGEAQTPHKNIISCLAMSQSKWNENMSASFNRNTA